MSPVNPSPPHTCSTPLGIVTDISFAAPASLDKNPWVVFVHGAMDRASGARRLRRQLGEFNFVAFDRRGYDRSRQVTPDSSFESQLGDLDAVIQLILARDPAKICLVGHSHGALVVAHWLQRSAQIGESGRVAGAVLWEPPAPWEAFYQSSLGSSLLHGTPEAAAETFMKAVVGERLWTRMSPGAKALRLCEGVALRSDLAMSRANAEAPDFSRIAVPVTVGSGSASDSHHRLAAKWFADHIRHSRQCELEGADHGVHLSDPPAFARLISDSIGATSRAFD